MSSTEPRLTGATDPLTDGDTDGSGGVTADAVAPAPARRRIVSRQVDALDEAPSNVSMFARSTPGTDVMTDPAPEAADDPLLAELAVDDVGPVGTATVPHVVIDDGSDVAVDEEAFEAPADEAVVAVVGDGDTGDEPEYVEVVDKRRGRLKARKVRRVVRYVSPWSVLKVSVIFYACLWIIGTIASVILWRLAVTGGMITNVEKFVARLFGEKSFTIDGREIFRASAIAGVVLVFAGTGFTVLMSLLFNVICDITGGLRFTVLELESTRREVRRKK